MKRAGFTMIELIFVIVILGILAAVAVPKLAATRSDAENSKMMTNVAVCLQDNVGGFLASETIPAIATYPSCSGFTLDNNGTTIIITGKLANGNDYNMSADFNASATMVY